MFAQVSKKKAFGVPEMLINLDVMKKMAERGTLTFQHAIRNIVN